MLLVLIIDTICGISSLSFGHFGQAHWFKMSVLDKDDRQTALTQSVEPIELSIYSWAMCVCVCVCVCARACTRKRAGSVLSNSLGPHGL